MVQIESDCTCVLGVELSQAPRCALDHDTALMVRFAEGHMASFDLLVERHRAPVVNHLYRLVGRRDVAEELAQDVFIRVFRSRARYRPSAKFSTWLFRISTNIGINWRRDTQREFAHLRLDKERWNARQVEVRDPALLADELLIRVCRAKEIQEAIRTLPPKQLAAVLLHKYEGLEYAQIAEVLGCSMQALKSQLFRAYETLRRLLAQTGAPVRINGSKYAASPLMGTLTKTQNGSRGSRFPAPPVRLAVPLQPEKSHGLPVCSPPTPNPPETRAN